ncbi:MAG: hypothetical protein Q7U54_00770 [Bacteroidales bacterium]|nr:hypothetical protein [Bacteroidales bacterium]
MKRFTLIFLFAVYGILPVVAQINFRTDNFSLVITQTGQVSEMSNPASGKNHLATGEKAALLKIKVGTTWEEPSKALYNSKSGEISLTYPVSKINAVVKVTTNKIHLSFRLTKLSDKEKVNAVVWGPYPTTISQTICEVIGVVRDGQFAIGLQALNPKTLGGILKNEGGTDDSRGNAAIAQTYGSSLQAYSLDRSKPRHPSVWNDQYPDMPVAAIPRETTIGSAIALFGCPENETLDHIGAIELAEGLPHPLINGIWHKKSPETGRAYLISDFDESTIDQMLDYTQQAGLMSLYHEGPFQSWGHFILDPKSFPNGNAGMKTCVEKAEKKGLRIGVHTLSTFINTNDPYVSPVPDKRLSETGASLLSADVTAIATEISVESNQYFKNIKPSTLHAVRIGDEIIRFRDATDEAPYKLLDCQRGAFETKAVAHAKGEHAGMLLDYPYNTLFPNFELQQEIAGNLGRFFNETGVSHMDFDGHEGCMSSGEGDYAIQAFAEKVFRETKQTLVNGTSRSSHYYWHICHYWNWGEPWYGGFRESQGDYRLENQPFLERNYMPNMLGWFLLSATTGTDDIEWMMARAAGYNAGFALVARYNSLQKNPNTSQLLALIKLWQEASKQKIFSSDQLARLKNPANDFHLEKDGQEWKLYPFSKYKYEHTNQLLQPGQPTYSNWAFENKDAEQPLSFTLTLMGKEGAVTNPWIELDGYFKLELPGTFEAGNSIVCDGKTIKLYNSKGSFKKDIQLSQAIPQLKTGKHIIKYDCVFPEESELVNRFIIKTISNPEIIKK